MAEPELGYVPRRFTDRSADTRAAILAAARRRFAAEGYEKTTIRAVAADAGIDASMVMRYYGSKANLFQESAAIDLAIAERLAEDAEAPALPEAPAVPEVREAASGAPAALADRFAQLFVDRWEDRDNDVERMVLRTAMTHPETVSQVQRLFDEQVAPPLLAELGEDPDARLRAALVMSQTLGIILCRYLYGLDPIASMDPEILQAALRDVVDLHLSRPLRPE
jgi:AcrR family transcriptional regulator